MKIQDLDHLRDIREAGQRKLFPGRPRIGVGMGTCGTGNGAEPVYSAIDQSLKRAGVEASLVPVGCFGFCAAEPLVNIHIPMLPMVILSQVVAEDAEEIARELAGNRVPLRKALCRIEEWDHLTMQVAYGRGLEDVPLWNDVPFFRGQKKIVLRDCGLINPEDIEEYIGVGGYQPLYDALQKTNPAEIVEEITKAKLRGRGGAGYPTGTKWNLLRQAPGSKKVLVCNADEGDPGAYMNRNEIESDPHMLIEGMLIGAVATQATEGVVYLRAEYPLAVRRLKKAIADARAYGLLGENILGSGFSFDLSLVEGAGAFVCGEETAMIASLEGKAGRPRPRPPFPAQRGLWGLPTNINNVETWCNVPAILARGSAWFTATGTRNSPGTKVFSLVGKIRNTGLVEMPLGTPLRHIVYEIGGGAPEGRPVKAIQTGGPSGGCIPAAHFDSAVDYESLNALGAIMGSGGMVVMDEDNCMVDVARYFIQFSTSESCGKCVPCRAGLDQALGVLSRVTSGQAQWDDLRGLEDLGLMIKECSLCGLGQTAPNPVLTTLRYFRDEYEEHIRARRCGAGVCEKLYLSPCENSCPLHMRIPGYLQLLREGRREEAAELVWLDNPLPASTGRVCQHPCEQRCRRADVDAAVNMREVHRHIADAMFAAFTDREIADRLARHRLAPTGHKMAVVGAGPAGLSAAFYLALLGHDVTVFDPKAEPGGMLRYSLPEYRLPKRVVDREINVIRGLGVRFVPNRTIRGDARDIEELEKKYIATFLAIGTWREQSARMPGEEAQGVFHAIDFLDRVATDRRPALGKRTLVIGGGNAAIDSARTALRLGSEVTVVYRRDRQDMPAIAEEVADAEAEGVRFLFYAAPERVLTDEQGRARALEVASMKAGEFDRTGRRKPVATGGRQSLECDSVILAIGERPDARHFQEEIIAIREDGTVDADRLSGRTDRPHVYAGGDVVTGPTNVSRAMGSGRNAARSIDRRLMGEDRFGRILGEFGYASDVPLDPLGGERNVATHLPAETRRHQFVEVVQGFSAETAARECLRCLRCDVKE